MAQQQGTQLPPPSVGTPFSETVGGLTGSSSAYSTTAPDTSVHATAPGPPAVAPLGSRNPFISASDVPSGAGTEPRSISSIPPPQLGAASSAAQPGGLLSNSNFSTPSSSSAQHSSSNVGSSVPSSGQLADRAQQAKDSAAQAGAQAGAKIGEAAQSVKSTVQSAELPAAPAQRPEGVARLESQDGVKNIITGIGGILVSAPGAALETLANKAGHPEIAQQIQAGVARVSGSAVDLGKKGYANAPTAEQIKGGVASGYQALPTAGQVKDTALNAHQSLPSVEQVKSTTGGLGQTAAHHAGTAQQYATQIAHDIAEKLPASLQAYVPESIKHPQSATSPSSATSGSAPVGTGSSHAAIPTTTNTIGHPAPLGSTVPTAQHPNSAGAGIVGASATKTSDAIGTTPAYPNVGSAGTGSAAASSATPLAGSGKATAGSVEDFVASHRV